MVNQEQLCCRLPARDLPVIAKVDLIVAGASLGGIAAALQAASLGASVFVISDQPYLGEDLCGTYACLFDEINNSHPLLRLLFPENRPRTPFHIKKALEDKLLDSKIGFLYVSYVAAVLLDDQQAPAGVIITNRSGQQVIRGKALIDATPDAAVARLAGARFQEDQSATLQRIQFVAVGNKTEPKDGTRKRLPYSPLHGDQMIDAYAYTFAKPVADWSFPAVCALEQAVRDEVWDADQIDAADRLSFVPPFCIEGRQNSSNGLSDPDQLPIEVFVPKQIRRLYIAGSCADVDRTAACALAEPLNQVILGEKLGAAAAGAVRGMDFSEPVPGQQNGQKQSLVDGVLHIESRPFWPDTTERMAIPDTDVPVLDNRDVIVVGGGTAGANAGISAARHGAKTLVAEFLHGLGGTQTMGRISVYWDGYREGFTREVDTGVQSMGASDHPRQKQKEGQANIAWKSEWYRQQIRKAGGEIWFGAMGCGALTASDCVRGVLLASPRGLGVVLAHVVIDATGSADIAIAAGAAYQDADASVLAVQGAGLPYVNLDDQSVNTDWTFVDDGDVLDVTRLFVSGKAKYDGVYDVGKLPQTRERRRIVGDHVITALDVINRRRYPDTISLHRSSFDTHGYTVDPYFTLSPPEKRHVIYDADVPLSSLLPKGLDNILVTGLGASAHRDAMPVIRMQPCLQNQGYSVGYLSAVAALEHCSVRRVDIKKIQKALIDQAVLPQRVLTDTDSYPYSDARLQAAAERLPQDAKELSVLLTNPAKAEKLLTRAFEQAERDRDQSAYAQALCILGSAAGLLAVLERVRALTQWDEGWNYTGMGQFGPCMSDLDRLIMVLGETRQAEALPVILDKAKQLTPAHAFSHFRAVSLACAAIGSPAAVPVLAELLAMEGVIGHQVTTLQEARSSTVSGTVDVSLRNHALREIFLARALYRCGDVNRTGERILQRYARDLHGYYARHARQVLRENTAKTN